MINQIKKKRIFHWPFIGFILDLLKLIIIALIIVWPIHHFVFQPFLVRGPSMEPTFQDKNYLIIEKVSYRFRQPARGDVIVFRSPINSNDYLIKRVIGLPDERVVIKGGNVYIYNREYKNGIKLDETLYLNPALSTQGQKDTKLKSNEYYVLGDNRNDSLDSRSFGPIKKEKIVGRVLVRGWPLNEITKFTKLKYNL